MPIDISFSFFCLLLLLLIQFEVRQVQARIDNPFLTCQKTKRHTSLNLMKLDNFMIVAIAFYNLCENR